MKKFAYISVLFFLALGFITGCSQTSSEDLYGTWQNEAQGNNNTKYYDLILGDDGTFIAYETYQDTPTEDNAEPANTVLGMGNGTFTFEDNKLNLTYEEVNVEQVDYADSERFVVDGLLNQTISYDVKLDGNTMTLSLEGKEITFEKQN